MNAVEMAEQLVAVGRYVQAAEQRLRQPIRALDALVSLGELWVDPVARLSELVAPHVAAQTTLGMHAMERSAAPERLDFQVPPAPTAGPGAYPFPGHQESPSPGLASSNHGRTDPGLPPRSPAETFGESEPGQELTSDRVSAIRLTRNSTSLMSILQSNVQARSQANRHAMVDLSSSSAPGGQYGRDAGANRSSDRTAGTDYIQMPDQPSATRDALPATEAMGLRSQAGWAWNDSRAAAKGPQVESSAAHGLPARVDRDDSAFAQAIVQSANPWPGEVRVSTTDGARLPLAGDETRMIQVQAAVDAPWFTIPPASQELVNWSVSAGSTAALSPAQIDQILDALNDRLEMLMLRMYGAI